MNIVVTGASRGIGFEVVKEFASRGGHHILAISRNQEGLNRLKDTCSSYKDSTVSILEGDLTRDDFYSKLEDFMKNNMPSCDVVLNNAGYLLNKPFGETENSDMEHIFSVNLFGPSRVLRTLESYLKANGGGHVVNIGSMGGYQGSAKFPGLSYYSASKAALACLTECLAEEWKESGVSVNCLSLGAVNTEMLSEAFPGYEAPVSAQAMGKYIASFCLEGNHIYNGKVLPLSISTP